MFFHRNKLPETNDLILEAQPVLDTIERLHKRIDERFNRQTSLSRVCAQLLEIARRNRTLVERLARPYRVLRSVLRLIMAGAGILLFAVVVITAVMTGTSALVPLFSGITAAIQLVIFIAAGLRLLSFAEDYLKRRQALPALRALRSIIHVVDMHTLTKDPSKFIGETRTSSSPEFELSEFQMTRYLDYCSEMVSLTAKVAALFGQVINDAVVAEMVSEIERLSGGMSQKFWQKIMILQELREREIAGPAAPGSETRATPVPAAAP